MDEGEYHRIYSMRSHGMLRVHAKFALDGYEPFEYMIETPPGHDAVLGNTVFGREGGPSQGDEEFRGKLYASIGRAVIASGHIEAGMKRAILTLRQVSSSFASVDLTWTCLHSELLALAQAEDGDDDLQWLRDRAIVDTKWAEGKRIKFHRDNFVHGYI